MKKIIRNVFFGIIILAIATFLGISLLASSGAMSEVAMIYQPAPTPGGDLEAVEANAGITIPISAREINAMVSGFRELDTWVRFELPANDLKSFMENTHCKSDLISTDPVLHKPNDLDPSWWDPDNAVDLVECLVYVSNMRQHILVDRTDNSIFNVYIFSIVDDFTDQSGSE